MGAMQEYESKERGKLQLTDLLPRRSDGHTAVALGRDGEPADAGLDLAPAVDARDRLDVVDERAVVAGGLVPKGVRASSAGLQVGLNVEAL